MPVQSETRKVSCTGNGVTVAFAVTFPFLSNSHLVVKVGGVLKTITTDYTVSGAGAPSGGTVTFLAAPANAAAITIERTVPLTQTLNLRTQGAYSPEAITDRLDLAVMADQQINAELQDVDADLQAFKTTQDARDDAQDLALAQGAVGGNDTFITSTGSTTARKLKDRFAEVINVKDFGAVGDAVTSDTAAIQAAVTAAAALVGGAVFFPAGTYVMGQVTIPANDHLTIFGLGLAKLKLTGASAGFWFSAVANHVGTTITGLHAEGDGVAASAQALVQNTSGAGLYDVRILNNRVKNTTIGISLNADGIGGLSAHKNCVIAGNYVEGSVGTASGQGYGIHVASGHGETVPMNCIITGNRVVGAQRHSIYVAKGWGVTVSGNAIRDHRTGVADGTQREALSIARGGNIIASGNLFDGCSDGSVGVWADTSLGIKSVLVSGNVFARPGNTFPMVMVGTTDPANEGGVEEIEIASNKFRLGATALTAVRVNHGKHIDIHHNVFRGTDAGSNAISLYGIGEVGASSTYSDEIVIERNRFRLGAGAVGVRIEPAFGGASGRLDLIRNRAPGGVNDVYQSGGAAIGNTGVYVDGQTVGGITITAPVIHKWFPGHAGGAGGGVTRPTVSGSRGGSPAVADALTDLATLGLITDSSTAGTATAALDFGSIAAGGTAELTIGVTGAVVGDSALATPNGSPEVGLAWCAYVSSANVVTVRMVNASAGAIDPASRTWRVATW